MTKLSWNVLVLFFLLTFVMVAYQNCTPYQAQQLDMEQSEDGTVRALSPSALKANLAQSAGKGRQERTLLVREKVNALALDRELLKELKNQYGLMLKKSIIDGLVQVLEIKHLPDGMTEEDVAGLLIDSGAVHFAEPDYFVFPSAIPDDPKLGSQWYHTKVGSQTAWDQTTGDQTIKVAVCDSGIDPNHPDLKDNLILPGINTADGTTNSAPITSHGTWVAGVIGARGNNALGIAGVNWKVSILPGRITNASDGIATWSATAECVKWGADKGAKVVNLSYTAGGSSTIDTAAQYLRSKGGLLVVCAGNNNTLLSYPDFASFLLVAATDSGDNRASFSNYGTAIDIAAPGTSILSTAPGGGYQTVQGTSFSTPLVAGAAALVWARNPALSVAQVESILLSTALDLGIAGHDNFFGAGRLRINEAVAKATQVVAPTPTPTPAPTATPAPTPTPTPVVNQDVSVKQITLVKTTKRKASMVTATVAVKNQSGGAVAGASVGIQWSGPVTGAATAITGSGGTVTFNSPNIRKAGTLTFEVISISGSGMTYQPASNIETSESIAVP